MGTMTRLMWNSTFEPINAWATNGWAVVTMEGSLKKPGSFKGFELPTSPLSKLVKSHIATTSKQYNPNPLYTPYADYSFLNKGRMKKGNAMLMAYTLPNNDLNYVKDLQSQIVRRRLTFALDSESVRGNYLNTLQAQEMRYREDVNDLAQ